MTVRLHTEATNELIQVAEWYSKRRAGLAGEFIAEVNRTLVVISGAPAAWPLWPEAPADLGIRRFVMNRFPFVIAYRFGDDVFVLAIAHEKRHPLYWISRATDE